MLQPVARGLRAAGELIAFSPGQRRAFALFDLAGQLEMGQLGNRCHQLEVGGVEIAPGHGL